MRARLRLLVLLAGGGWGCVYYNGLWSAHRYASDARRQERDGLRDAALLSWAMAATTAESVAIHHPHSGWLPEALVTAGEGTAGAGDCAAAAPYLDRALTVSEDSAIIERVALVRGKCALAAGGGAAAEALGGPVLHSRDAGRRREAALLVGRALRLEGSPGRAAAVFAQSSERAAGVEEVLSLIEAGQTARADTLCGALVKRKPLESDWDSIFATFARAAGAVPASGIVGRLVPRRVRLTSGARARLLLDDGRRLLGAGDAAGAQQRFLEAVAAAPDSLEADQARVAGLRARVAQFTTLDSVSGVANDLAPYAARGGGVAEARRLQAVLTQVMSSDTTVAEVFRAGELARDSLDANPLASALLLGFARREPRSLFAPKAILAALPLNPDGADSLTGVLDRQYATSPYTLAMRGAPSPGFLVAEDSLARLFGLRSTRVETGPRAVATWAVPLTGKRGPLLDPAEPVVRTPVKRPTLAPGRRGVAADTIN